MRVGHPAEVFAGPVVAGAQNSLGPLAKVAPATATLGAYVHAPFCTRRCHYCSFNTAPWEPAAMARYLRAATAEIALAGQLEWASRVVVGTVFVGGGTPSLLVPDALAGLLDALRTRFTLAPDAEVTVECNPESVTRTKLEGYRAAGVNRVSLGVQALDDAILGRLGRLHGTAAARAAYAAAREAGIANVSVDLMYGLPGLELERWERGLHEVLGWHPEHLSAYGLTLDPGSVWGAAGVANLPGEESVVAQYWALARAAAARGYEHYEISNYARPGFRSRHNLTYWQRGEYLAFGPGAAGFVGTLRWTNVKPVMRYAGEIERGRLPIDSWEHLDAQQALGERLILGLRTGDGIPRAWLDARMADEPALAARVDRWADAGWITVDGGRARLTEAGFLLSDALFIELL